MRFFVRGFPVGVFRGFLKWSIVDGYTVINTLVINAVYITLSMTLEVLSWDLFYCIFFNIVPFVFRY
jgi:hypothetical protein